MQGRRENHGKAFGPQVRHILAIFCCSTKSTLQKRFFFVWAMGGNGRNDRPRNDPKPNSSRHALTNPRTNTHTRAHTHTTTKQENNWTSRGVKIFSLVFPTFFTQNKHARTRARAHAHTYAHTRTHLYTHTHTHTHTRTHAHVLIPNPDPNPNPNPTRRGCARGSACARSPS